ncbi:hypothetical protein ElyMa_006136700 [Elysia marginata]|uniref:Uncharacterized protein n=1 Tax=Elysia marginata TaxID=1093978 RepID=A0AAV4GY75_9GAST|nr:hypothetical protein ElyMa_006136700 [Elysia marginata]
MSSQIERLARNTWAMEEDGVENGELLSLRDHEDVGGSAGGGESSGGGHGGGGGPSVVGYGGAELDITVGIIQTKTEEKRRDSKNSDDQCNMSEILNKLTEAIRRNTTERRGRGVVFQHYNAYPPF